MKIKGSSKIVSKENISNEKEQLETLINNAEAIDLIHEDVVKPADKLQKVKTVAHKLLEKAEPLLDKVKPLFDKAKPFKEKQKQFLADMLVKFRGLSPHADKMVTAIDKSVTYITNPNPLDDATDVVQTTRPPAIFGIWVMIITFGFFMMWAILAPLDSATHAMGKIILESKKRIIQHPEGGVIEKILVKDGQDVTKGQTLIILDDTQVKARRQQVEYRYFASLAEVARLTAEKDNSEEITFPEELLKNAGDPEVQKMIQTQEKVFTARMNSYKSNIELYEKSISKNIERKNSIIPQLEANKKQVEMSNIQVASYKKLYAKQSASLAQLHQVEGRNAEIVGNDGALKGQLAGVEHEIIQSQIQVENLKHDYFEKIVSQLKEQQAQLSVNSEALKEYSESLNRTVITAPEAGTVSNLNDTLTPKGVIHPSQTLMEIIPQDDELIIEAKILAKDIAPVKIGQTTRVQLNAYRARIVPKLDGKLISLSADVIYPTTQSEMQMTNGQPYYKARIVIDKDQLMKLAELKDVKLYPGMDVDVMIVVGTRTMMKYLMDPITLSLDHAFRER